MFQSQKGFQGVSGDPMVLPEGILCLMILVESSSETVSEIKVSDWSDESAMR